MEPLYNIPNFESLPREMSYADLCRTLAKCPYSRSSPVYQKLLKTLKLRYQRHIRRITPVFEGRRKKKCAGLYVYTRKYQRYLELTKNGRVGHPNASHSAATFLDALELLFNTRIEREVRLGKHFFDGRDGKLLIEVDSDFWHYRSGYSHPINDIFKTYWARNHGYTLIRFNINSMADTKKFIREYLPTS